MNVSFRSLRARLTFFVTLLLAAAIGTSLAAVYWVSRDTLERLTLDRITLVADLQQKVLSDWLAGALQEAHLIESLPHIRTAVSNYLDRRSEAGELREVLVDLRNRIKTLREIYLIARPSGRIVVDTNPTQEVIYMNRSEVYEQGSQDFHVKSVYPWPLNQEPTVTISFPVTSAGGNRGVLALNLDLATLDTLIRLQDRLGQTGRILLVDRFNVLVSGTRYGQRDYPRGISSPGIENALTNQAGRGSYKNAEGTAVLGDYRWLKDLEMALVVEVATSEALAPGVVLGWTVFGLGLVLFLVSLFPVFRLSFRLTRPLGLLTVAAQKSAAGDWGATLPLEGQDEIAQLGEAFRDMIVRLSELFTALKEQQAFEERLIDSLPGLFYLCDADLQFKRWNRNGETLLGYTLAQLNGLSVGDLVFDPADRASIEASLRTLLESGGEAKTLETTLVSRTGAEVPFLLTAVRVDSPSGASLAGVGIDLTDRRRLENQLLQSQKLESVGRLAGGVAHDFNNILTAIIGNLDLCRFDVPDGSPAVGYLENATKAARKAAALTRQLLSFSRKSLIKPQALALDAVLRGMEGILSPLLGDSVILEFTFEPELWPAWIDPGQFDQIVLNLVVNARDAMPEGGLLSLELSNHAASDSVCFTVSDTGTGMEPAVLEHVFEPFFTTKDLGKGTGLGLATVFGAIKQNKGSIEVASEPGRGTSFRIFLPRIIKPQTNLSHETR